MINGEFVSVLMYIKVCEIPIKLFKKKFSHQQAVKIWLVYKWGDQIKDFLTGTIK